MKNIFWVVAFVVTCFFQMACNAPKGGKTTSTPTPVEKPTPSVGTTTGTVTPETPTSDEKIGEIDTKTLVSFIKTDQLNAIMAKAKKEKKVVFIDFFTTWCAPCRLMDQSTFMDEDIATYMNDNCVSMKLDAEKGEGVALKIQYGIEAYPSYVFIDAEGNEVSKKTGSMGIEEFKKFMKTGVWKVKNP